MTYLGMGVVIGALLTLGCSHSSKQESAPLVESTLSRMNPPPVQMTPRLSDQGEALLEDKKLSQSKADYYFTIGEGLSLKGEAEKAIEQFRQALIYDEKSSTIRLRLAQELFRLGQTSEAIEEGQQALRDEPQSEPVRMFLASSFTSLKMYEAAQTQYQEVLKLNPNQEEARIFLGALLAEQKKYEEAIRHFESLASQEENSLSHVAYYYLGRVWAEYDAKDSKRKAKEAYKAALKGKPDFEEAALALSQVYLDEKKDDEAIRLLSQYQERQGPSPRIAQKLAHLYLSKGQNDKAIAQLEIVEEGEEDDLNTKMKITMVLIQQKKLDAAIHRLKEILVRIPDSDKVRFYLAAVHEEKQEYSEALPHFINIPPKSSFYGEARVHAAYILKLQGQIERALEVAREGVDNRPDIPQIFSIYASLLDEKKDFATGVAVLSKAVERFPTNAQLRFFYGSMLDRNGEHARSIQELLSVIKLDENHAQALNYLAYTFAEQERDLDQAEKWARKAVSLQPQDAYIIDTLGWVLFKQGRVKDSIPILEKAFNLKPDESVIAEHLGDAYHRFQLPEKARRMYLKAAENEKDSDKVKKIRAKITALEEQRIAEPNLPYRSPASAEVQR